MLRLSPAWHSRAERTTGPGTVDLREERRYRLGDGPGCTSRQVMPGALDKHKPGVRQHLGEPAIFFTAAEYGSWPLVLVRLAEVGPGRLTELVTDAWRMRAPEELAAEFDVRG